MEIRLIVREGSQNTIGKFLLENKDFFKKNYRFSIERKSSEEEIKLRSYLNITSLPIIIIQKKIIQGEKNILSFFVNLISQNNEPDNFEELQQNDAQKYLNDFKNNKLISENENGEEDYRDKVVEFIKKKKNISETESKTFKRNPQVNVDTIFNKAYSENLGINNDKISEDEILLENWYDILSTK